MGTPPRGKASTSKIGRLYVSHQFGREFAARVSAIDKRSFCLLPEINLCLTPPVTAPRYGVFEIGRNRHRPISYPRRARVRAAFRAATERPLRPLVCAARRAA